MSKHEVEQRIRYLVEHGGLWDDPLDDLRRRIRWALWLAGTAAVLGLVELALATLR